MNLMFYLLIGGKEMVKGNMMSKIKKCTICNKNYEGHIASKYCKPCRSGSKLARREWEKKDEEGVVEIVEGNKTLELGRKVKIDKKKVKAIRNKRDPKKIKEAEKRLSEKMKGGGSEEKNLKVELEHIELLIVRTKDKLTDLIEKKIEILEKLGKTGLYKNCFGRGYDSGDYECTSHDLCSKIDECKRICS